MDIFWIYKPKILLENYYVLLPTNKMTRIEQMNTITRLLMLLVILSLLFEKDNTILLICLTMIIMIIVFYFINKTDKVGVAKDLKTEDIPELEKYTNLNKSCINCPTNIYDNKSINYSINDIYNNSNDPITKTPIDKNVLIESGYIDFDGNYRLGRDFSDIRTVKKDTPVATFDKFNYYKEQTCRKPTVDNPFANIVFSDYLDAGNLAEPCNIDDKDIQKSMNQLYNSNIYRNIEDVFERENSQRLFYTMPITTIPNKQTEFANWLFKTGPTCKENSSNCTYFEEPYMSSPRY
jgi:hypothetical protein